MLNTLASDKSKSITKSLCFIASSALPSIIISIAFNATSYMFFGS